MRFIDAGFKVNPYVSYDPRFDQIILDGSFTANQLQGILDAVKEYKASGQKED